MAQDGMCGIYGFRNSINGKWYIGQSVNIKERIRAHKAALNSSYHNNEHFLRAWKKNEERNNLNMLKKDGKSIKQKVL